MLLFHSRVTSVPAGASADLQFWNSNFDVLRNINFSSSHLACSDRRELFLHQKSHPAQRQQVRVEAAEHNGNSVHYYLTSFREGKKNDK